MKSFETFEDMRQYEQGKADAKQLFNKDLAEKLNEQRKELLKLVKENILFLSDSNDIKEAIDYFESIRHKDILPRNEAVFKAYSIQQLAILFKLLIDVGELELDNNVIKLKQQMEEKK